MCPLSHGHIQLWDFLGEIHLWEEALSNFTPAQELGSIVSSRNLKVREPLLPCLLPASIFVAAVI